MNFFSKLLSLLTVRNVTKAVQVVEGVAGIARIVAPLTATKKDDELIKQYDNASAYVVKNVSGAYEQAKMLQRIGILKEDNQVVEKIMKLLSIGYQRKTGENLSVEAIELIEAKAKTLMDSKQLLPAS